MSSPENSLSTMLALMVVSFVGNNIAALQATGALDMTRIRLVSLTFLAIH